MRAVARILGTVGVLLLVLGAIAGVVHREVLDADRFASHVDAVRTDPDVARQLGILLTDRILAAEPDLTAIRPLIEATATATISSPTLGPLVRVAVAPTYRVLTGDDEVMVLRLADVAAIVIATATAVSPSAEASLPTQLDIRLSDFAGHAGTGQAARRVHVVGLLSWLAPVLGLLLLSGAGLLGSAQGRLRRGFRYVGRGTVAAGITLAVLLVLTGFLAGRADRDTLSGALTHAVWRELSGAFWTVAGLLLVAGAAIALAARPGTDLAPRTLLRGATTWIVDPGPGIGSRLGRAGALLVLGVALVLQPLAVVGIVLAVVGAALVLLAAGALVTLLVEAARTRRARGARGPASGTAVRIVGWVAALALVVAAVVGAAPTGDDLASAPAFGGDDTSCNGHAELCDRHYDEVAFPATHNSMAAADEPGWFFAEQPDGVISQLDHGVRVLLIDSWYGQETSRSGIVANTDDSRAAAVAEAEISLGAAAVASAQRLRESLDLTPRGPVEPYLCHGLCELGSTKWEPLMAQVRTWLDAHPREVVTFFVQDEVSPQDTADVVRQAGLLPYVYTPPADGSWPTLGSMIDSGHRLVFLMENRGGGPENPWLIDGFEAAQDTPFLFASPDEFTCAPNRGDPDNPLFLVNHWITDKSAEISNATRVNALDVLLPRLEECDAERDRLPNFVAVDFYDRGDLMTAVDDLNGLR